MGFGEHQGCWTGEGAGEWSAWRGGHRSSVPFPHLLLYMCISSIWLFLSNIYIRVKCSSLHFSHGLRANSSGYRYALTRGILLEAWERCKNSLLSESASLKRWGNTYELMIVYQKFTGASRPDSYQRGQWTHREQRDLEIFHSSLDLCQQLPSWWSSPTSYPAPPPFHRQKRQPNLGCS